MDHDFLDGIDEHFERLMKLNGNGRRNGSSRSSSRSSSRNGSSRDRTLIEIMDGLKELSGPQKTDVLEFVRSLNGNSGQLDFGQSLESESDES